MQTEVIDTDELHVLFSKYEVSNQERVASIVGNVRLETWKLNSLNFNDILYSTWQCDN